MVVWLGSMTPRALLDSWFGHAQGVVRSGSKWQEDHGVNTSYTQDEDNNGCKAWQSLFQGAHKLLLRPARQALAFLGCAGGGLGLRMRGDAQRDATRKGLLRLTSRLAQANATCNQHSIANAVRMFVWCPLTLVN